MWHKEGSQDSVGRRIRYKMKKISVYGKDITVKEKKGAGDAKIFDPKRCIIKLTSGQCRLEYALLDVFEFIFPT